ncbi:MAG: leucine dehydrogenase, partial [Ilumatobacteraceae bacterium]|nr:leucine dehydrogenase [Ilumatobacteraceae bacterium]
SVYRFFAWGMIPIGTALGGLTVVLVQPHWGREAALRAPFFVAAALGVLIALYAVPRLTTERLDTAREEGIAARAARAAALAEQAVLAEDPAQAEPSAPSEQ